MGLELAEQMNWELPDVIIYPTGGGTGLIGMWKAFHELKALGWLKPNLKLPRMVSVQSDGCAPIATAFARGDEHHPSPFPNAHTIASGLRVPIAVGDFMILRAVRESGGQAIAVDENRLGEWTKLVTRNEGISLCPEAAACVGALQGLLKSNWIQKHERVVIFNTGGLQKYFEFMAKEVNNLPVLDKTRIDWGLVGNN